MNLLMIETRPDGKRKSVKYTNPSNEIIFECDYENKRFRINSKDVSQERVEAVIAKMEQDKKDLDLRMREKELAEIERESEEFNEKVHIEPIHDNTFKLITDIKAKYHDKYVVVEVCDLALDFIHNHPMVFVPKCELFVDDYCQTRHLSKTRETEDQYRVICFDSEEIYYQVGIFLSKFCLQKRYEGTFEITQEFIMRQRNKIIQRNKELQEAYKNYHDMVLNVANYWGKE